MNPPLVRLFGLRADYRKIIYYPESSVNNNTFEGREVMKIGEAGLIFLVLTEEAIIEIVSKRFKAKSAENKRRRYQMGVKLNTCFKIVIPVFFVIQFFNVIEPQDVISASVNEPTISILQPSDGDSVPSGEDSKVEVTGTYSQDIKDDIWVIIWPEKASGSGWPQSDDAKSGAPAIKKDGRWSVTCYFGGSPQDFEITVYTATKSASAFLRDKIIEWYKSGNYPGISATSLPKGLTESNRIKVTKPQ